MRYARSSLRSVARSGGTGRRHGKSFRGSRVIPLERSSISVPHREIYALTGQVLLPKRKQKGEKGANTRWSDVLLAGANKTWYTLVDAVS